MIVFVVIFLIAIGCLLSHVITKVNYLGSTVSAANDLKAQVQVNTLRYNHLEKSVDKLLFSKAIKDALNGPGLSLNVSVDNFKQYLSNIDLFTNNKSVYLKLVLVS